jgi:hypothetical protein
VEAIKLRSDTFVVATHDAKWFFSHFIRNHNVVAVFVDRFDMAMSSGNAERMKDTLDAIRVDARLFRFVQRDEAASLVDDPVPINVLRAHHTVQLSYEPSILSQLFPR